MLANGKSIRYIVDKSPALQGKTLNGITIKSPAEITEQDKVSSLFLVCIVKVPYCEIKRELEQIGCQNVIQGFDYIAKYCPEVDLTNGWVVSSLNDEARSSIREVYGAWEDSISREHYLMVLYWRILRREIFFETSPVNTGDKFFPPFIVDVLTDSEVFVDCGAYIGGVIQHFSSVVNRKFKKVIAYEPDEDNYTALVEKFADEPRIDIQKIGVGGGKYQRKFISRGISSKFSAVELKSQSGGLPVTSIDDENLPEVTFLKLHLEGMELETLQGAIKTIERCRPIITVTLYHSEDGLYRIPMYLIRQLRDYNFYHRLHMYCGQSSVLYAVPKERFNK